MRTVARAVPAPEAASAFHQGWDRRDPRVAPCSLPAPLPCRLLQGDTPGRWHARRRRRLRQGGDAGSGGTGEPSPLPFAAETNSHSPASPVLSKKRRAAIRTPLEKSTLDTACSLRIETPRSELSVPTLPRNPCLSTFPLIVTVWTPLFFPPPA